MSNRFDVARLRERLQAGRVRLGEPIHYAQQTESTNDDALRAARDGAAHGALFVADEQSRGRGRHGRAWWSGAGENLLFSCVLRPVIDSGAASGLTLAVGLAVRDALLGVVQAPLEVKWPNDLLVDGRKLAGILLESQVQAGRISAVIAGVGVNVHAKQLPEALAAQATSLALLGARELSREALLADILSALESRLDQYQANGVESMAAALRSCDALYGKRVRVEGLRGVAQGLDGQGRLLLLDDGGMLHALSAGSVEWD